MFQWKLTKKRGEKTDPGRRPECGTTNHHCCAALSTAYRVTKVRQVIGGHWTREREKEMGGEAHLGFALGRKWARKEFCRDKNGEISVVARLLIGEKRGQRARRRSDHGCRRTDEANEHRFQNILFSKPPPPRPKFLETAVRSFVASSSAILPPPPPPPPES